MDGAASAPQWDLEDLVPGGPGGAAFAERRRAVAERLAALDAIVDALPPLGGAAQRWIEAILAAQAADEEVTELGSYAECASAADARSPAARAAEAAADELKRTNREIRARLAAGLDAATDPEIDALLALPAAEAVAAWLGHLRAGRLHRLPADQQLLRVALEREALTGWGRLYDQLAGDLVADVRGVRRGVAEITAMRADPDPELRREAFHAGAGAWRSIEVGCAHALTHITGFRQQLHDRLGTDELAESLHDNRLRRATLDAMWSAADAARPALVRYLRSKARRLGKDALDWWDLEAPLGAATSRLAWDEAVRAIAGAFDGLYPELGAFAREVDARRWVDARPGQGRRGGGFCTGFPRSRQSRIFMTYSGSMDSATTLAHEIGHAWHNRVLEGTPAFRAELTSALAETASTFAEAVFRGHVLATAHDPQLRLFVLDQQLQAAVAFLMDIPHRFAFERRLYALRRDGPFEPAQLTAEVVAAQQAAFGGALGSWNPTFWCSKLHFYIPDFGFYNWPYAFGYLFSAAVHARARAEGAGSIRWVRDLLMRTGWQPTEALAAEVLGVDLEDPAFWRGAVAPVIALADAFEAEP